MKAFLRSVCLSVLVVDSAAEARAPQPSQIKITDDGRACQPGEVIRISVASAKPLKNIYARAFEKDFPFYASKTPLEWRGLIGIDLETKPDTYEVTLQASYSDGTSETVTRKLEVKDKIFPTRRLTVDEKFVNPPPETLDRIREESKRLNEIFARATPERQWSGPFMAPVPGPPNSSFGKRSILNGQPRSPHSGADFDVGAGTPVRAPNSGKIVLASDLYYSGNTIIIDHGMGLYSHFAHLSRFAVKEGAEIKKRQVAGYVGSTGRVTGPHLHWSVRLAGARVDPLSLIAAVKE
jgi:murein DD-endopeptidase MepM/ murein hydrolase activator NlpD